MKQTSRRKFLGAVATLPMVKLLPGGATEVIGSELLAELSEWRAAATVASPDGIKTIMIAFTGITLCDTPIRGLK